MQRPSESTPHRSHWIRYADSLEADRAALVKACRAALDLIGDFASGQIETLEEAEETLAAAIEKATRPA